MGRGRSCILDVGCSGGLAGFWLKSYCLGLESRMIKWDVGNWFFGGKKKKVKRIKIKILICCFFWCKYLYYGFVSF